MKLIISIIVKQFIFLLRNNVKTKVVTIKDDYTINFKEIIDKWSNHNFFKQLYSDNSMKLKLYDFEVKYNKVILQKKKNIVLKTPDTIYRYFCNIQRIRVSEVFEQRFLY